MFQHLSTILLTLLIISPCDARRVSQSGGFSSRGQSASRSNVATSSSSHSAINNNSNRVQSTSRGYVATGSSSQVGSNSNSNRVQSTSRSNVATSSSSQFGFNSNSNRVQSTSRGYVATGSSSSRGRYYTNTNQSGGGYRPNTNTNQVAVRPTTSSGFRSGTGVGSRASSNTFKNALVGGALGATGGILAYKAGKAIIKSPSQPFNYDGRNYYWDNYGTVQQNEFQCSMPLSQLTGQTGTTTTTTTTTSTTVAPTNGSSSTTTVPTVTTTLSPDQVLATIQYSDGKRPKTIVWGCKKNIEQCCGTDCCPVPVRNSYGNAGLTTVGTIVLT